MALGSSDTSPDRPLSPFTEIAAYEALWSLPDVSYKKLSEMFASHPGFRPSDFVEQKQIDEMSGLVSKYISEIRTFYNPNILIKGTFDYPGKLLDAKERIELIYYTGNLDLLGTRSVSVVGTRGPSENGIRRTQKLVKLLVADGFTIVSGLAKGIDTAAHTTAIENSGKTIAVIGTPLNKFYPSENQGLQREIAQKHLLISQVPFHRYSQQGINGNRIFFPERNKTMSALSEATIIVEAGETSGTLVQARAALAQGRKLFILDSCFLNPNISWPKKFLQKGAIRVQTYEDIKKHLDL